MEHLNFKQGLFQSKGEVFQYIGDSGKEYVPYDFEEDIVPAINNLLPNNEKMPLRRSLRISKYFCWAALSEFVSKALISVM